MPSQPPISFRLDKDSKKLLANLKKKMAVSGTDVIRIALRKLAGAQRRAEA